MLGWFVDFTHNLFSVFNDITAFITQPIAELGGVSILNVLSVGLVGFLLTMLILGIVRG